MLNDYALQEVKGIKKSFDNASRQTIMDFIQVPYFDTVVTSEWDEIFNSTEGMEGTKKLSPDETPPTMVLENGYNVTLTPDRFGGAIQVTTTDMEKFKDSTTMVDKYITKQRDQALKTLQHQLVTQAHLMLNEAFDSGSDFLAPDGVEICGNHSWATGTTFDNSATDALDQAAVDTALEYAGDFTMSDGKPAPLNFTVIVVKKGSAAAREAKRLFAFGISPTAINDINIYEGELTIIEVPYITTANKLNWFMFDLSVEVSPLYVGINKVPTMEAPIVQNNGAIRSNVEGFWKTGVQNMPYNVYGSTGTT